jgi:hypothetical protein
MPPEVIMTWVISVVSLDACSGLSLLWQACMSLRLFTVVKQDTTSGGQLSALHRSASTPFSLSIMPIIRSTIWGLGACSLTFLEKFSIPLAIAASQSAPVFLLPHPAATARSATSTIFFICCLRG